MAKSAIKAPSLCGPIWSPPAVNSHGALMAMLLQIIPVKTQVTHFRTSYGIVLLLELFFVELGLQ